MDKTIDLLHKWTVDSIDIILKDWLKEHTACLVLGVCYVSGHHKKSLWRESVSSGHKSKQAGRLGSWACLLGFSLLLVPALFKWIFINKFTFEQSTFLTLQRVVWHHRPCLSLQIVPWSLLCIRLLCRQCYINCVTKDFSALQALLAYHAKQC